MKIWKAPKILCLTETDMKNSVKAMACSNWRVAQPTFEKPGKFFSDSLRLSNCNLIFFIFHVLRV